MTTIGLQYHVHGRDTSTTTAPYIFPESFFDDINGFTYYIRYLAKASKLADFDASEIGAMSRRAATDG